MKEGEWVPCFDIPNIKIPSVAYLGFSAETGELSDNFDIISVATKNLYSAAQAGSQRKKQEPGKQKVKGHDFSFSKGGSWSLFFLKVVLFLVVCAGAYVGYTIYRSARRNSRF